MYKEEIIDQYEFVESIISLLNFIISDDKPTSYEMDFQIL